VTARPEAGDVGSCADKLATVSYSEHAPPPALRPWVQCAWEQLSDADTSVRVVPDGGITAVLYKTRFTGQGKMGP